MSKKLSAQVYLQGNEVQRHLDLVLNKLIELEPADAYSFLAKEFDQISVDQSLTNRKDKEFAPVKIRATAVEGYGDTNAEGEPLASTVYCKGKEAASSGGVSECKERGVDVLRNGATTRGLAFNASEREVLGLHGLLPPVWENLDQQIMRVMWTMGRKRDPLQKFEYFMNLLDRNARLFFATLTKHIRELLPVVYHPTVGKACLELGYTGEQHRGLYLTIHDLGNVEKILRNWPSSEVRAIVVTDGQQVRGIGDMGAYAMGMAVGKVALYTACAGLNPEHCLPVVLDVGTDNEIVRADPLYCGLREARHSREQYDALVQEFLDATTAVFGPACLVQFEEIGDANAVRLLDQHRANYNMINDTVQGTAAVAVAGVLNACVASKASLEDHKFLIHGEGSMGCGIASLLAVTIASELKVTVEEARRKVWFVDERGLVSKGREAIAPELEPFAHEFATEGLTELGQIIQKTRVTCLIGASGKAGAFTRRICGLLASNSATPIVLPMSCPASHTEGKPLDAYDSSEGTCIFAAACHYEPVVSNGASYQPGHASDAFIFPGLALGVLVSGATRVPDELYLAAAKSLAKQTPEENLAKGCMYPALADVTQVAKQVAADVAAEAFNLNLAKGERPADMAAAVEAAMWSPTY